MIAQDIAQLPAADYWRDPILIVGANPVGLITALGLGRYKIPSVVLDEGEGASLESNQLALLDAATLSILDAWRSGLGQFTASQGLIPNVERIFLRASQLSSRTLPASAPGTSYPRQVILHHAALEQLLLQALQQAGGCQVLWQHRIKGFTHDHTGIDIEVESPTGTKFLRAPYLLVTSDYATAPEPPMRSSHITTTDALLAAHLPANNVNSPDERYLSVDILTELETPAERWFWLDAPCNPGRVTQVFSLPGGLVRILYQLGTRDDLGTIQQAEPLHRRIEATLGARPYEVIAISSHARKRGVIERFKEKRTIFLGSASHHIALFGASEVNIGALDAWNLVWKLALVRAGQATPDLLESYHHERQKAVIDYMKHSEEILSTVAPTSRISTWKRNMAMHRSRAFVHDSLELSASPGASGSIAQADSPLFSDDNRLYLGGRFTRLTTDQNAVLKRFRLGPMAGMPAPSLALPDADTGMITPLLGRISSGFLALCFTNDIDIAMNQLRRVPVEMSSIPILLYLITPTMPAAPAEEGIIILLDAEHKAARAYNAGHRSLYLVRPDGIIAARRFDSDFHDIPALLRHAVGEDVVDSQAHIPRPEAASSGY